MYLRKATREIERSSFGVREEANMDRSTDGVTGILVPVAAGESGFGSGLDGLVVMVREEVVEDMVG